MNREWIEIISSVSALLIVSVLLFGTAVGRHYHILRISQLVEALESEVTVPQPSDESVATA